MRNLFHSLFHPEIFQGHLLKSKYFEGWYYKLVSANEANAIAIIPGIALYDPSDKHAFIQIIDGVRQDTNYHRFDIEQFRYSKDSLDVSIGNNRFTSNHITLDLEELTGKIDFPVIHPLSSSWFSPGIMGWYSYAPFMQCYHGIVSLYHDLLGKTTGSLGDISWDGGVGYIEKDWGTSFPKCWIWMHSNHFKSTEKVSLMASVAHIPWMGHYFPGFIVLLWIDGVEHRFASYNGSKMKCKVDDDGVTLAFRKGRQKLHIYARRGITAELRSPIKGQMTGKLNESLQASLEVHLMDGEVQIWESTATTAGLEVAGDISILESTEWRK